MYGIIRIQYIFKYSLRLSNLIQIRLLNTLY